MTAYYNENDPKAAAWLRELIKAGHIAPGEVDERSIEDVRPGDLAEFTQCHFFAGIGGWSYALRLANWPDEKPVWTGSCPCQPFSAGGKRKGFADARHLWPAWFHLIRVCRPESIFGEQVANNLAWLDLVSRDLENEGYAVGASVLGAHSVGAPHIRQRLYYCGKRLDDAASARRNGAQQESEDEARDQTRLCLSSEGSGACELADSNDEGSQGRGERRLGASQRSPWESSLVDCRDGKRRPVEPGTFPLAHGVPGRVGLLRGYGNAIVPQVAAAFIEASGLIYPRS